MKVLFFRNILFSHQTRVKRKIQYSFCRFDAMSSFFAGSGGRETLHSSVIHACLFLIPCRCAFFSASSHLIAQNMLDIDIENIFSCPTPAADSLTDSCLTLFPIVSLQNLQEKKTSFCLPASDHYTARLQASESWSHRIMLSPND